MAQLSDIHSIEITYTEQSMLARKITLWTIAVILTLASAYYQRKTGPSNPLDGEITFHGSIVEYSLGRSNRGLGNQEISIVVPDQNIRGRILYKRYKTNDIMKEIIMKRDGDHLSGVLPEQPPAGKLEYYVELMTFEKSVRLPAGETVVTRHTGAVPSFILIPHIIFMFLAMLFAIRAGLETLFTDGRPRSLTFWVLSMLVIGGLGLGPLVQHYAFGPYWTGIPFGWDMTDNKTLIAFIAWLIALVAVWNKGKLMNHPRRKWFVLAAAIIMMLVFLIPHSIMGSELDYSKQDADKPVTFLTE